MNKGDKVQLTDGRIGVFVQSVFGKKHGFRYIIKGPGFDYPAKEFEIAFVNGVPFQQSGTPTHFEPPQTKRFRVESDCHKQAYPSERAAKEYMKRIRRNSSRSHIPVRAYKCSECGQFHLTSLKREK